MDGAPCIDGNGCTQTDTCQGGFCVGGNTVTCAPLDQCHFAGVCDPATGMCSDSNKPDGSVCSDENPCTQVDTCQGGACTSGNAILCGALDQCHLAGMCNPITGVCSNPSRPDGNACDDGNACTQTDICQGGFCVGANTVTCNALDQCHLAGGCDPTTGACSNPERPDGDGCNEGNACTQIDTCQGGACIAGNQVDCAASDQCHIAGV